MATRTPELPPEWQNRVAKKWMQNQEKLAPYGMQLDDYSEYSSDNPISVLDVPSTSGVLTTAELTITESYDATALLMQIAGGNLRSVDVVRAFCKRAAIAQQCTNCLTEIMFEEAIRRAEELDEYFEKEGRTKGPLHGLPVSLKVSRHHYCA
jgi:hypothetical protein